MVWKQRTPPKNVTPLNTSYEEDPFTPKSNQTLDESFSFLDQLVNNPNLLQTPSISTPNFAPNPAPNPIPNLKSKKPLFPNPPPEEDNPLISIPEVETTTPTEVETTTPTEEETIPPPDIREPPVPEVETTAPPEKETIPPPEEDNTPNPVPPVQFTMGTLVPDWMRKGSKESEASKITKTYVVSLFKQPDGKIITMTRGGMLSLAERDPTFKAIWDFLISKNGEEKAYSMVRGVCDTNGSGRAAKLPPPPPPPKTQTGLTKDQIIYFRGHFGGGRIARPTITSWLSSRVAPDPVWLEVLAGYGTVDKAKRAIVSHFYNK